MGRSRRDRKSTRLNSSHSQISYAVFCLKKKMSFWYNVTCPDTVQFDWATVTLRDITAASTRTLLARTCTINQGWKQGTASLIAGHNYKLRLISHDDNFAGDPTFTKYDDVSLNVAANDFSISVSPNSAAVNPGTSATATVSTASTAGTAQTVSLSASGLPAGAAASFNPTSVTSGGSSTLTVSTATSTPAGTFPITITGTGSSATHTTTFTLTVNGTGSGLTLVSTDPFTNTTSQHATEVEPDTLASGTTIVSSSQVGRFNDGGGSDISFNTSTDGGTTWVHGMLPGITVFQGGGTFARVSDPSVAFDAKHNTWMISGLVINSAVSGVGVTVSRSTNGGTVWQNPVLAIGNDGRDFDKEWIVCDNTSGSPFFGNCYIEVDVTTSGNRILMSRS